MSKKSVKGDVNGYCGIECQDLTTGRIEKYDNRADCPSWWNNPKKTGECTKITNCGPTMEPAERCINSDGDILHADKSACDDDMDKYWGKVCVPKSYTKPTGHIGYHGGKYKNKKTKKQMKKSKSKRTKHITKSKKNKRK
jgi:hypothetical protein